MRILGKTPNGEAYRVAVELGQEEVVAHVSDALLSEQYAMSDTVTHEQAYEWIAAQQHDLTDAIMALQKGAKPRPPFHHITLE